MKTFSFGLSLVVLLGLNPSFAAIPPNPVTVPIQVKPGVHLVPATPTEWAIVTRDANSQLWQRTTYEQTPDGKSIPHLHSYTELATGLNYKNALGQWTASKEEITILPDGSAAALQGQHKVYFPADIYHGVIRLVTPDGQVLQSQPSALSYDDGHNTAIIAILTNSVGHLVGNNQVIYPNAFVGIDADLRYTYTKGAFEQDVILRSQPPLPAQLHLNPATTRIQMLTEFINPPVPTIHLATVLAGAVIGADQSLNFGRMCMGQGRAFFLDNDSISVPVAKHWTQIDGRQFLVEEVPTAAISTELENLPILATKAGAANNLYQLTKHLKLPPQHLTKPILRPATIRLAKLDLNNKGFVLDYQAINTSLTNYTFKGDATYYISGMVRLYGTNTFEGGAVIKSGFGITINGSVNWLASFFRPVVFTAKDDNTVGETVSGSSGSPSGYYGSGLSLNIPATLSHFRFAYADQAISAYSTNDAFYNGQLVNCRNGIFCGANNVKLRNVLFANVSSPIGINGMSVDVQNASFNNCANLSASPAYSGGTLMFTNCIFANVSALTLGNGANPTISGDRNGFYNSTTFGNNTIVRPLSAGDIFQTVGGGGYYLALNAVRFRNTGTTNIDPVLFAGLATKTTYPPIAYTNVTFASTQTFSPQAQRDNDGLPDLGYHYDPLDYTFGGCTASSNITFTAGTSVGWFRTTSGWQYAGYGVYLKDQQIAAFQGTATAPCYWVRLNTVQENDRTAGYGPGGLEGRAAGIAQSPEIWARFMKAYLTAGDGNFFRDDYGYLVVRARDCEFGSGGMGGYVVSLYLTNCLFERTYVGQVAGTAGNAVSIINGTFKGGSIYLNTTAGIPISVLNCALDETFVSCTGYGTNSSYVTYDYNAYTNSSNPFLVGGSHDVLAGSGGFNWQKSWLGNHYLPSTSALINAGSTTANLIELYHFTTQINQTKETNSVVDIGYHYVATDAYGKPLDSNNDGILDYLEDGSGNGLTDMGELSWLTSPYNGLSESVRLMVFTPFK